MGGLQMAKKVPQSEKGRKGNAIACTQNKTAAATNRKGIDRKYTIDNQEAGQLGSLGTHGPVPQTGSPHK